MSETAINYVCAEAPGIRVAGLLKLKGTFVSPIVAESLCLASSAGQVLRYRRKKIKMPVVDCDVREYFSNYRCQMHVGSSSDILYLS